jgi:branched-chain amino acid transport system substrate-binding protein
MDRLNTVRFSLLFLLVFLAPIMLHTGCGTDKNEVPIGVLFPMTGDAGSYGERGRNGVDLAVREINERGGIRGKKIRVIYEDSRADPKTGVSAMTKLATVDQVPVVIGDIVSAVTLAVAPTAESNKIVLLSPTSSAPAISQAGDYIFRTWPSDLAEGKAIATFAYESGFKNVGILYMQNEYGVAIQDIFTKTLTGLGGQVTQALGYKPDETDFRSYLSKLASTKPDAIYLVSYYKDGALALKQAKELGIQSQFLATTAIEDPKIFEVAGSAAEGVIYPLATGYDAQSTDEAIRQFRARYNEQYKAEPDWVPAQCYDAINLLAFVMEKAGFTGPEIQREMAQVKGYHGVTGEITFDENGDVTKPVTIKTIKNGGFQKIQEKAQATYR